MAAFSVSILRQRRSISAGVLRSLPSVLDGSEPKLDVTGPRTFAGSPA